jgi:glycosyltransferase involved in cell wall biosynthesis
LLQQTALIFLKEYRYHKMPRVVYIVSDIDKALAFEWISESLPEKGWIVSFILLNPGDSSLERYLNERNFTVTNIRCRGKLDWLNALLKTREILRKWKPDVVHAHLITAGIIGLTAAKLSGCRQRVYTRHHSTLHHVYHPKGVFWDKYINSFATKVIAISSIVKRVLMDKEGLSSNKVVVVPHGFKLDLFLKKNEAGRALILNKYGVGSKRPVIGVISRFTKWKGVQYIIPAFKNLLNQYPESLLMLYNAHGDFEDSINRLLQELPLGSYRTVRFEAEIAAALSIMDVFVHVPIDEHSEAFGQIYVEALAAGVPSIFTLSGIAPDFIKNEKNALVVPYRDSDAIYEAMIRLSESKALREQLSINGPLSVKEKYDLPIMIEALDKLYSQCLTPL